MNLKLRELVWEITPRCDKRCDYCGSANILDKEVSTDETIINIAKSIADYGVEEVTLSGGEPLTIKLGLLHEVIRILAAGNVKVKIITNGHLFSHNFTLCIDDTFRKSVDAIGLSINTQIEIDIISEIIKDEQLQKDELLMSKIVIITNFGTHNVFEFDKIFDFIKKYNFAGWQIQLTQGKYQLNAEGIKYLRDKIFKAKNPVDAILAETLKEKIVIGDNLQDYHECTAGILTCGITYKGEVVGCLSERSWCEGSFERVYGIISNIKGLSKFSLKDIWEDKDKFKDIRFGERKSCRDCIEYPLVESTKEIDGKVTIYPEGEQPTEWVFPKKPFEDTVIVYGVKTIPTNPPINPRDLILLYGVQKPIVMTYAVFNNDE
jgi:MoaA/NifB/PqqE/SkfB family radical SAM enzyme